MMIWQVVVFVLSSLGILYISRESLSRPRSHGFYRFFVFELLVALFLLNVTGWFDHWSAWYQMVSWILLIVCIVPLAYGVAALTARGEPDKEARYEPELLGFERTTKLVTDGIYHYIRHPLYSSLFLLGWGIFFKSPSYLDFVLALAASVLLVATARADESECIRTFGTEYRDYMHRTTMFIPYVF